MIEVQFEMEKETKNTVRFNEVGVENVIGTLYVSKRILATMGNPDKLTVTVGPVDAKPATAKK